MKNAFLIIALFFNLFIINGQTIFTVDGIRYITTGENKVSVTTGSSITNNYITIPATVTFESTVYSVTSIGDKAFYLCSDLKTITIPNSVTDIGERAFCGCINLTSIDNSDSLIFIGDRAFESCDSLLTIDIPATVKQLPVSALMCYNLQTINVSEGNSNYASIEGILYNKDASTLKLCPMGKTGNVDIPSTVSLINDSSFYSCCLLENIIIPNSVTEIGTFAFYQCKNLDVINIPFSVNNIGDGAFYGCSELSNINVDAGNSNYSSLEGVLFNKEKTRLIQCPNSKSGTFEIPSSVTDIGRASFYECKYLKSITIPNSVLTIESIAFASCNNISNIDIPSSVRTIGDRALGLINAYINVDDINPNYSSLNGVLYNKEKSELIQCPLVIEGDFKIPSTVTNINEYAFEHCRKIKSLSIPISVNKIGTNAFWLCGFIESLYVYQPDPANIDVFNSQIQELNRTNCILYVPVGSKELYENAMLWNVFDNIFEMPPVRSDWPLFNPNHIYEYDANGEEIEKYNVKIDSMVFNGIDTSYIFNRMIKKETDGENTTTYFNCANVFDLWCDKSGDKYTFSPTKNFIIYTQKPIGYSWDFSTSPAITASVKSKQQINTFDRADSIMVISLSNNDSIVSSKIFGILHFPDLYETGSLNLIGVKDSSTNYGITGLDYAMAFNHNIGDVFYYFESSSYFDMTEPPTHNTKRKMEILDKFLSGDTLSYKVEFTGYSYNESSFGMPYDTIYFNYKDSIVYDELIHWCSNNSLYDIMNYDGLLGYTIAGIGDDNLYYKQIGSDPFNSNKNIESDVFYYSDYIDSLNLYSLDSFSLNPAGEHFVIKYKEGLGVTLYTSYMGEGAYSFEQIGYIIDGIETGTILSDGELTSIEDASLVKHIKVYPTVTDGTIYIEAAANDYHVEILNMNGSPLKIFKPNDANTSINISDLPGGIYLIKVKSGNNQLVEKIFKK